MKPWAKSLGAALILLVLGYAYLYPGSQALLEGRTDIVMSDDTDPSPLPYIYDQVVQRALENPSWLLYGSVPLAKPDPTGAFAYWMPWGERVLVLALWPFVNPEQMTTAVSWMLMVLSGLAMYALARYLGWRWPLAMGLAIAWAFNPFTRARAKVHVAMSGTFHLPLIFLFLFLVARGRTGRSLVAAALSLLLACFAPHYFIITTLFLTPLFLIFIALQPETRADWRRIAKRMALAALPAVVFLLFNFAVPLPPSVQAASPYPKTGETQDGSLHPFLTIYAAHAIDYLGGDIALANVPTDLNPLREWVNASIIGHLEMANTHERTNGIRWTILVLAFLAVVGARRSPQRNLIYAFLGLAACTFWLAASPDFPIAGIGPSGWLYRLVSQVRVPNRAGIGVHFASLMLAGLWLAAGSRKAWVLWAFPVLMIADFPPFVQAMPMNVMRPAYGDLQREHGTCGAGMYFPFVDNWHLEVLHYHTLQRLRGSDCSLLNAMMNPDLTSPLVARFPPTMEFLTTLDRNVVAREDLRRLAACTPLSFILFDDHVPKNWRDETCASLGWKMNPDFSCVSPTKGQPLQRLPQTCL